MARVVVPSSGRLVNLLHILASLHRKVMENETENSRLGEGIERFLGSNTRLEPLTRDSANQVWSGRSWWPTLEIGLTGETDRPIGWWIIGASIDEDSSGSLVKQHRLDLFWQRMGRAVPCDQVPNEQVRWLQVKGHRNVSHWLHRRQASIQQVHGDDDFPVDGRCFHFATRSAGFSPISGRLLNPSTGESRPNISLFFRPTIHFHHRSRTTACSASHSGSRNFFPKCIPSASMAA